MLQRNLLIACVSFILHQSYCDDAKPDSQPAKIQPIKCMNYWPVSVCENYINIQGKSMCTKNILFGRYQCCTSCAKVLKVTVNEDGIFESKGDFKFYDESCPEATDRMIAGNSWTPWCLAYKDEADGTNCETAIFQYRCYKTCNIDCGNTRAEQPPATGD